MEKVAVAQDPTARGLFAQRLRLAIERSGFSYREVAYRAQSHLPEGMRISDISVWAYATGHRFPHRAEHIAAIAAALELTPGDLTTLPGTAGQTCVVECLADGQARLRLIVDVTLSSATALAIVDLLAEGQEFGSRVTTISSSSGASCRRPKSEP